MVVVLPSAARTEPSASTPTPLRSHSTTVRSSPRSADWRISRGSEAAELTAGSLASGGVAGMAAAGCGGAACRRMSSATAGWPLASACRVVVALRPWASPCCRAVRPFASGRSVLAVASSSACVHPSNVKARCTMWTQSNDSVGSCNDIAKKSCYTLRNSAAVLLLSYPGPFCCMCCTCCRCLRRKERGVP
jgi:hypothetical protein